MSGCVHARPPWEWPAVPQGELPRAWAGALRSPDPAAALGGQCKAPRGAVRTRPPSLPPCPFEPVPAVGCARGAVGCACGAVGCAWGAPWVVHVVRVSCARNELSSNFKGSVVAGGSHRGPRLLPPPHGESGPLLKCSWDRFLQTRGGDPSPEGARKPPRACELSIPIRNVGATKKDGGTNG